ncbi:GNAT family N-acetyltransferase [Vibrio wakamikoensis]|uniref:GNAT family N-acetyltransferase n=1 Tax=Vibrio wakamikoensis TaxID=2910251 RepID=UPI003D1E1B89
MAVSCYLTRRYVLKGILKLIHLRELKESDLLSIQSHASNPEIGKMSNVPSPYPPDGAKAWFAHVLPLIKSNRVKVFVIENDGDFSGLITLNNLSIKDKRASVDYWIRADFHGKGIGTQAVKKVIEIAASLGIEKFSSGCLARNTGSKKVLLKNGFEFNESIVARNGKFMGEDILLFTLERT